MLATVSSPRRRSRPLLQLTAAGDSSFMFPAHQRGALLALLRQRGITPSRHQRRGGGLDLAGPTQPGTLVSVGPDRLWIFSTSPAHSTVWGLLADLVEGVHV